MNKKQLWDSILQQAISGKLVPQLDTEPAVEQIGPAPAPDDVPFELPEKWKWVKIGDVFNMHAGKNIKASNIKDTGLYPCYGGNGLRGYTDTFNTTGLFNLIGRQGALCGNIHLVSGSFYATEHAVIAEHCELISPHCAYFFLTALNLNQYATATAQPGIAVSKIAKTYYPLPPLAEQKRIATKLEELKPLVDQFGEAHDKLSELEADFPRKLKASILQAAMQGKLVPQQDTEPAVEQLGPAPSPDEVPFALPEKWKWVQLKHLNLASFSGGTPTKNNPDYWNGTIPWASIKDLSVDSEELNATQDHITEKGVANSSTKLVEANNIIVGMRMGLDKIAINKISVAINQDLRAFYLDYKLIDPKFFIKFYKTLRFEGSGTTVKGIKKNELMVLLVPLPPLEEQRRIVERIEQLFAEVDKMSACKAP